MSSPPMLRARERDDDHGRGSAFVTGMSVVILTVMCLGLLIAGVLAIYDWRTPASEAPLAAGLTGAFGLVMAFNVVAAATRDRRAGRSRNG